MVQAILLMSMLRGSGTGVMVVLAFAVGLILLAITGNAGLGFLLSFAISAFFIGLIVLVVLHVVRFFLVAVLSTAVSIKRVLGSIFSR